MIHGTTIICVRRDGQLAIGGDGQVTLGQTVLKKRANKIRKLGEGKVVAGFAGSTADAFTLFEKFESKFDEFRGNLLRAAVELAKDWRTDRVLRRLEALLIVADREKILTISGNGDVVEPDDQVAAVGSGGPYALAAARSLLLHSNLEAKRVVEESLKISAEICIFSNENLVIEEL